MTMDQIKKLSFGLAEPVLISKFSYESSYSKYYSNLIPGFGSIRNGLDKDSFVHYTSLAAANNRLNIKDHLTSNAQVFHLPSNLIQFYEINSSCLFMISYNFFFKDVAQNNFSNKYDHILY